MLLTGNVPGRRPKMLQGILSDQRHISAKSALSGYGTDEVAGSAGATATDGLGSSFQGTSNSFSALFQPLTRLRLQGLPVQLPGA